MAGNHAGGLKAAKTNKSRYGEAFYANVARRGGKAQVPKGFAKATLEQRQEWGRKGGRTGTLKTTRRRNAAIQPRDAQGHFIPKVDFKAEINQLIGIQEIKHRKHFLRWLRLRSILPVIIGYIVYVILCFGAGTAGAWAGLHI